ncbi:hypothetical protein [Pelagicoccus sp. SDUM812003]|uniref:hypothetical protein n=1 Tax=Pelagicoccus sp. SDUM812003 TaxID=3041267 RepID=UPI00280E9F51|nr:hypothetical protein [Pelagicoccus sp. SDUM812003]MDQ8202438.1 hypothetical protein [Pelagicoccus sp. SDUM812003]
MLLGKFSARHGLSELAGFGADHHRPTLDAIESLDVYRKPDSTGYDGQYYLQIALDPSLSDPQLVEAIDHPSYRARRIALPALSYALGLGKPALILQVHSALNIACLGLFAWLLLRWIPVGSLESFGRWFFCVFSMGALESVRYSLADLPSLLLGLIVIAALEDRRSLSPYLANTLAALTKETALLNSAAFLAAKRNKSWPSRSTLLAFSVAFFAAAIPLGLWMAKVAAAFPLTLNAHDNIVLPFSGLYHGLVDAIRQLAASETDEPDRYWFRIVALLGLSFQFAYLILKPRPQSRIWTLGMVYGLLFLCLGDAVWRGYWAGCRIALPMTVAFNLLLEEKRKGVFWIALCLSNLTSLHAIVRWL